MKKRNYLFYTLSCSEDPENIRYIGATCVSLNQRFSQHKYVANHKDKRSTPVSKWMYSKMEQGYKILINQIDEISEKYWEQKEIDLIAKYRKKGFNLLNLDEGGKGSITKGKRSKSGIQRSADAHKIRIVQLDLEGNYIQTFNSVKAASKFMGNKHLTLISNVLKKRSKTSGGYYWFYEEEYLNNEYEIRIPISSKKLLGINIYRYCPDSFLLLKKYESIKDVYRDLTGNSSSNSQGLKNAIKNKNIYHESFWSYDIITDFTQYFDNRYKIFEINGKNEIINKYKSNIEAAEKLSYAESTISNIIRNKTKTKHNTYLIKNLRTKI